ncbi:MFS transporter [Microbacterium aurantiacum]|uniref:MFS transporter n=1 Tax=Microbacterium aurantiacum TaxID=162393 RepID=UPI000C80D8A2|nr:MFS transporter [Microbacterium aurantiacum]
MNLLRAQPQFGVLWSSNLCASLAGWSVGLALSVHVYTATGSPVATGALVVSGLLPAIALGSLGGVIADRVDRTRLLHFVSWARVGLLALVAVSPDNVIILFVLSLLQSTAMQFYAPAEQATVATIVPAADLPTAMSANSAANNVARIAGPVLGGTLMGLVGFTPTIAVATGLLLASALMLLPLRSTANADLHADGLFGSWRLGLRYLRRNRPTRAITVLQLADPVKEGALTPLFPVLMLGVIGTSASWMGAVNGAFAITAVLATPLIPAIVTRLGYRIPIAAGASLSGVLLLVLALHPTPWTALAVFLLSGFPFTVSWVSANTLLLLTVTPSFRGTAVSTVSGVYAAASLFATAGASLTAEFIGTIPVLIAAAAVQTIAGPLFLVLSPTEQHLFEGDVE